MWLVAVALAEDLTWTCPDLDTPADAKPYDPTEDLGVEAAVAYAYDAAHAWYDRDCEVECTYSPDAPPGCAYDDTAYQGCDCALAACTTPEGATIEWRDTWWWESPFGGDYAASMQIRSYTVVPPPGQGWTSLRFTQRIAYEWATSYEDITETVTTVSWEGALRGDWPVDGTFTTRTRLGKDFFFRDRAAQDWTDAACAWSTSQDTDWDLVTQPREMNFDGRTLVVEEAACGTDATVAFLDGVPWGQVDDSWAWYGGTDGDADGFPAEGGADCNDADSTVHACAEETWYDGVDQDCGGDDDYDADGDGHDALAWGGDDCDDVDPHTFPGTYDEHYDGVDGDCAGGDDYDADGDGYASDDYGGDDCDDRRESVHPGAEDEPGDGRDQDCDGADAPSPDTGTPAEEPPSGAGCGAALCMAAPGGPAWLGGLAALAALRRRRSGLTR